MKDLEAGSICDTVANDSMGIRISVKAPERSAHMGATMLHWGVVRFKKLRILLSSLAVNHKIILEILITRRLTCVRWEILRQPGIISFLAVPFLASSWVPSTRLTRIVNHCLLVQRLGWPFLCVSGRRNEICALSEALNGYALAIETPRAMLREGLLTLALLKNGVRIYALSFIYADTSEGIAAYVGAVQGNSDSNSAEIYRSFTKSAFGVRPRDFIVEAFRIVCCNIGVYAILGVSAENRHQKNEYFRIGDKDYDKVKMNYNELWMERGGALTADGFFRLSAGAKLRSPLTIPARKRALYRRRNEMWAEIDMLIAKRLGGSWNARHRYQAVDEVGVA